MQAFLSSLSILVTVFYVVLTYRILHANRRQITASIRPYVHFEVLLNAGSIEAFLKNSGKTAAYNVQISVNPQLQASIRGNAKPACLTSGTLPMVLPEREICEYCESIHEFNKRTGDQEPVFTGTVNYKDSEGNTYSEPFRSDLTVLREMAYIDRPIVSEELKKTNDLLAGIRTEIRNCVERFNR